MEFLDRFKHVTKDTVLSTMFLTAFEKHQLQLFLKKDIPVLFDGGHNDAERCRAYINKQEEIICFKISSNDRFLHLTHQNILGSLLALNIKREAIGDIIPKEHVFFCIGELQSFIEKQFTMIGRSNISLQKIDGSSLIKTDELEHHRISVESLRLDLIISKITKLSRKESVLLIENDQVKKNHLPINKITSLVSEQDILSIHRFGRFVILDTKNRSKKGKIVVIYGKYI